MEVFNETFDVRKVLEEVITTVDILAKKNRNKLIFRCDSDIGLMHSDVTKIRQILLNLLGNASKFTDNGTITLSVSKQQRNNVDWICFSIADTGIGISEQQQKKLFKAFSQVDASSTRKYGGTGLGLSITKRFTEMLGGEVSIQSEPNKGTVFTAYFPLKMVSRQSIPELEQQLAQIPPVLEDKQSTILVIDDDADVRGLLSKYIKQLDYRVVTAKNGHEGLQLAHQLNPQLITLDVMMPSMDGWTVLTELKSDPQLQHIPVVMLSMIENQELGYSLGAAEYLLKPIEYKKIMKVLDKYRTTAQRGKILVVEDDIMIRDMLKKMLNKDGWKVIFASNGKVGLNILQDEQLDIILLDLMMPKMDGYEFISCLRRQKQQRKIPIVVLTAKDVTLADKQQLSEVHAIFQKGAYHREELLAELRDLLIQNNKT